MCWCPGAVLRMTFHCYVPSIDPQPGSPYSKDSDDSGDSEEKRKQYISILDGSRDYELLTRRAELEATLA